MFMNLCDLYLIISSSSKCLTHTTVVLVIVNSRGILLIHYFLNTSCLGKENTVIDVNGIFVFIDL